MQSDPYLVIKYWVKDKVFDSIGDENTGSDDNARIKFCKEINAIDTLSPHCYKLLGELFEEQQQWKDALQAYKRSRKMQPELCDDYHLRIGRNLLAINDENAKKEFEAYSDKMIDSASQWRLKIIKDSTSSGHLDSLKSKTIVKSWLKREREKCLHNNDLKGALDVRAAIMLASDSEATGMLSVVTPIAVEVDMKLVENKEQQDNFLNTLMTIRDKIKSDIGIRIPGIRLRGNEDDYLKNSYIIMINEVPIVLGKVEPKKRFSPGYQQSRQDSFNPRTGENEGEWLDEKSVKELEIELWGFCDYAAYHLEAVLRSDLTPFIGMQETRNVLDEWQKLGGKDESQRRLELVSKILPDADNLLCFTQLLQGLVKECVPVTSLVAILHSFQASKQNSKCLNSIIEAARLRLKGELPGNKDKFTFMALAPAFENEIESNIIEPNDKRVFAIQPEPTKKLLEAFRAGVTDKRLSNLVIVTQTEGIRPFVRRLIEIEFPQIIVLSSPELRPELHQRISETIGYPQSAVT